MYIHDNVNDPLSLHSSVPISKVDKRSKLWQLICISLSCGSLLVRLAATNAIRRLPCSQESIKRPLTGDKSPWLPQVLLRKFVLQGWDGSIVMYHGPQDLTLDKRTVHLCRVENVDPVLRGVNRGSHCCHRFRPHLSHRLWLSDIVITTYCPGTTRFVSYHLTKYQTAGNWLYIDLFQVWDYCSVPSSHCQDTTYCNKSAHPMIPQRTGVCLLMISVLTTYLSFVWAVSSRRTSIRV